MTGANTRVLGGVVLTVLLLLAAWQLTIWTNDIPAYNLPGPVATFGHIRDNAGLLATVRRPRWRPPRWVSPPRRCWR
ncbi:hypothetical protein BH10ACT9_BH10ACT9_50140 [soil metagenome]